MLARGVGREVICNGQGKGLRFENGEGKNLLIVFINDGFFVCASIHHAQSFLRHTFRSVLLGV